MNSEEENKPKQVKPRDGYDNTGTQGKDSLKDDAFQGTPPPQQNPHQTDATDDTEPESTARP